MAAAGNVVAQDVLNVARLRMADDFSRQDARNRLLREIADVVSKGNPGIKVQPVAIIMLTVWRSQPLKGPAFARMTRDEIAWLTSARDVLRDLEPEPLSEKSVRLIIRS